MRKLLLLVCLLVPLVASPINIVVRIYSTDNTKTAIMAPRTGTYILLGDGKVIDSITPSSVYEVLAVDSLIEVKNLDHILGKFSSVRLKECTLDCTFNIKPASEKTTRLYNDELLVSNSGGYLKMVNMVDFEHYLTGVVECEAGHKRPEEFYKAQAIICRTYALNNLARHLGEYYELCDAVHCQVYKGTSTIPEIVDAVASTKGLVIIDSSKHLINAAFYSNCGGYTLNSEDVWSSCVSYLRAVRDTFCRNQLHANWEKHISLKDWSDYLDKKEATLAKTDTKGEAYWDSVPEWRRIYLYDKGYLIPLKDMRVDLNLHSTYFSIKTTETEVILKGRGNGHRVGFCQEGAIYMSQLGYTYSQILRYYYQGIQVVDSSTIPMDAGTR